MEREKDNLFEKNQELEKNNRNLNSHFKQIVSDLEKRLVDQKFENEKQKEKILSLILKNNKLQTNVKKNTKDEIPKEKFSLYTNQNELKQSASNKNFPDQTIDYFLNLNSVISSIMASIKAKSTTEFQGNFKSHLLKNQSKTEDQYSFSLLNLKIIDDFLQNKKLMILSQKQIKQLEDKIKICTREKFNLKQALAEIEIKYRSHQINH